MKPLQWLSGPWAIGVWIALAIAASIAFGYDVMEFADQHEGLAAWVQAVFSVVAIIFAAKLNYRERLKNRQERMEALRGLMIAAVNVVVLARARIDQAVQQGRGVLHPKCEHKFDEVLALLGDVAAMELGSTKAPTLILEMKDAVREAKGLWDAEARYLGGNASSSSLASAVALEVRANEYLEQVEAWLEYRTRRANAWLLS